VEHGSIEPEHYGKCIGQLLGDGDQCCGLYVEQFGDVCGGECFAGGECKCEWFYDVLYG